VKGRSKARLRRNIRIARDVTFSESASVRRYK
jgi:hypothetical protein